MIMRSCAALLAAAGLSAVCAGGQTDLVFDFTPLPGTPGAPQSPFMPVALSESGALCGQAGPGGYWGARWTAAAGTESVHPSPSLLGSWVYDINDKGETVGIGCIPPAGGNGPCGLYMFRNTPGAGNQQLDWTQAMVAGVFSAYPLQISASGAVAMGLGVDVLQGGGDHAVFYRDDIGWVDLSPLVTQDIPPRVRFVDMNDHDQVLLRASWSGPVYRWSPEAGPELIAAGANVSAVDINNHGQIAGNQQFGAGGTLFRYTDGVGLEQLDPVGAFSNAYPDHINDAGMILGRWDGGLFLYTDESGMQDLGVPAGLMTISGFNARGDITGSEHDPQTYVGMPKVKFAGQPMADAQALIDPGQTRIVLHSIGPINDRRQFTVVGRDPTDPFVSLSFLVQARCPADYDADGVAAVPDVFAFLADWFAGAEKANVNGDGVMTVADIFTFLAAWFAGC